jgi:hypothetical protein
MKYLCVKKCYFNDRLWDVGEVMNVDDNAKVPSHFTLEGGSVQAPQKPLTESLGAVVDTDKPKVKARPDNVGQVHGDESFL